MPRGRPRLDIRRSPYLAAAALTLAFEARFRARYDWRTGRNRPLSRRAAMRLAALAIGGEPVRPEKGKSTKVGSDSKGGLYSVVKPYSHVATIRSEEVAAIEQSIRRIIKASERNVADLELLDELSSELLGIMIGRDAAGAMRRIEMALEEDAPAFIAGISKVARALSAV